MMKMFKHNTIDILKSLNSKELSKLTDFISSPYFNKSHKLKLLYMELIKYYPSFDSEDFSKARIGKLINSKGMYKDSELRDYLSKLLNLFREFLIIERLDNRQDLKQLLIINEVSDRGITRLVNKYKTEIKESFNERGSDRDMYITNFYLTAQIFNDLTINKRVKKSEQAVAELQEMHHCAYSITIYNFISLIIIFINILVHQIKFNQNENHNYLYKLILGLKEQILKFKIKQDDKNIIELYFNLLNAFMHFDDTDYFFNYKKVFYKEKFTLGYEEIKFHNAKLISYCILKKGLHEDTNHWNKQLFELYKEFLEQEFFITRYEKYLSCNLYRDILMNAVNINNLPWLDEFIQTYTKKLNPKFQSNMRNYALAFLAFKQNHLNDSLEYINKIQLDYFIYKYDIKNLKLVIFYEKNDLLGVLDLSHAYEEALRKDKLLIELKKITYKNFLYFLKKLIQCDEDKFELGYTYNKLLVESKIVYKTWLTKKYESNLASTTGKTGIAT